VELSALETTATALRTSAWCGRFVGALVRTLGRPESRLLRCPAHLFSQTPVLTRARGRLVGGQRNDVVVPVRTPAPSMLGEEHTESLSFV
jgi:hypothetical protein